MSELIKVEEQKLTELFKVKNGIEPVLKEIESFCKSQIFDCTTEQGRKDAKSLARKVSSSKTLLEKIGKEAVAPLKSQVEIADRQRIDASKFLDSLRDDVKKDADAWEKEEKERIELIKLKIKVAHESCAMVFVSLEIAKNKLTELEQLSGFDFQEMKDEAIVFLDRAKENVEKEISRLEKESRDREEFEKLKREKEERESKEQKEKEEKERQEREERIKKETEERVKREEQEKLKREEQKREQERILREKDIENKKRVHNEALQDLMAKTNLMESELRLVITAIAKKEIRNLCIKY